MLSHIQGSSKASRKPPFSGSLSCQDALHAESGLDRPTISSTNQRPYCFLGVEFLELVSVANNPGLRRMIASLRNRLQVQLQIMSV
ncbi:hypothetical protein [Methylomonas sp. AM2-LC]|uniref:hypothetical protein n=1 Tax=Methylomonas sp. AM2-LC TaxID=3153301 RepID=UPI003262F25F